MLLFDLLLQCDLNEHADREADLERVEKRHVFADVATGLKFAHAREAGRGRQMHRFGEFDVGYARVTLQAVKDVPVGGVEDWGQHNVS